MFNQPHTKRFRQLISVSVVSIGMGLVLTAFTVLSSIPQKVSYVIDDKSNLSIAGTTNVNSFDCKCKEKFGKSTANISFDDASQTLKFEKSSLALKTTSLDCDNDKMNEDLQDAMDADDYPYILVELHSAQVTDGALDNPGQNAKLKANAVITIRNVSHWVVLEIAGTRLAADQYRFVCSHKIKMTDYGIEPPTALFGLIKVRNTISINFDLYTRTGS